MAAVVAQAEVCRNARRFIGSMAVILIGDCPGLQMILVFVVPLLKRAQILECLEFVSVEPLDARMRRPHSRC